ncbi:hypothetical protein HOK021_39150 [Streptomyces hygroscopicus]|nr:hypothetical protein HOK021_39150 [Streptomyces hygroscopicus]
MPSSSSWRQTAITPAGTGGRLGEEPLITAISWRPTVKRLRRQPCGTGCRVPASRTETVSQREREREREREEGGREEGSSTDAAADAPGRHMPAGQRTLTASLGTACLPRNAGGASTGPLLTGLPAAEAVALSTRSPAEARRHHAHSSPSDTAFPSSEWFRPVTGPLPAIFRLPLNSTHDAHTGCLSDSTHGAHNNLTDTRRAKGHYDRRDDSIRATRAPAQRRHHRRATAHHPQ